MADKNLLKRDKRFYESLPKRMLNQLLAYFLKMVSILPFWIIYGIADFMYVLLKYVVKYRKKVILENLRNAFPGKDEQEIIRIKNNYYRHFCDFTLETVKLHSMSEKQLDKRMLVTGMDELNEFARKGQSVIVLGMHYSNWEWCSSMQAKSEHKLLMVYNPIRGNQAMERFILHSREKWGGKSIPVHRSARALMEQIQKKEPAILWLAADQTPPANSPFWTTFLNQETPFFAGPEKIAAKTNQPVVFLYMKKRGRGKYEANVSLLIEEPQKLESKEILLRYIQRMEEVIRKEPDVYLWSHRRWKHARPAGIDLTLPSR